MRKVAFSVDLKTAEELTTTEQNRLSMEISKTISAVMDADVRVVITIKSGKPRQRSLFFKPFSSL